MGRSLLFENFGLFFIIKFVRVAIEILLEFFYIIFVRGKGCNLRNIFLENLLQKTFRREVL